MEELWDVFNTVETSEIINNPSLFNISTIHHDRPALFTKYGDNELG